MMCNHDFKDVGYEYPGYEKCSVCDTYHSVNQKPPAEIYIDNDYWDTGDGATGRSTFKDQISNMLCIDDCGISKVDRILQFVPERVSSFLEIGCAPGVLLKKMEERGATTYGIEPSEKYIKDILAVANNSAIFKGFFPDITKSYTGEFIDCIVGMDVFEHVEDYISFINEVERLLRSGGTCVLMSPIILEDGLLRDRDMAHPGEHCWIWSQKALEPYLKSKFTDVKFSRWIVGHEIVSFRKQ